MRNYTSGNWGFQIVWGLTGSVFPRAFAMALPNAIFCYFLSDYLYHGDFPDPSDTVDRAKYAIEMLAVFSTVMFFVLFFRSNVAYSRWWEGGTLLQKTRGEWFNSYSSLIAFSSTDPKMASKVEEFHHLLARLMSLLFCAALQQCSPNKDRAFEVMSCAGIEKESLTFLAQSSDKVEVILQWIQRSTIINMQNGILPIAPPVMSRAFQEISRGIVNLQNARKIADFPFPFPYAQMSMVMLGIHYVSTPIFASMMTQRTLAPLVCFLVVFFLWCVNFIALQLEYPFGERDNDLPMVQFQRDWNKSIATLLHQRAQKPPRFTMANAHRNLELQMSDGSSSPQRRISLGSDLLSTENASRASQVRNGTDLAKKTDMDKDKEMELVDKESNNSPKEKQAPFRQSELSTDLPSSGVPSGEIHLHSYARSSDRDRSSDGDMSACTSRSACTDWDHLSQTSPYTSVSNQAYNQTLRQSLRLAEILSESVRRLNNSENEIASRDGRSAHGSRSAGSSLVLSKEEPIGRGGTSPTRRGGSEYNLDDCERVVLQPPLGFRTSRGDYGRTGNQVSPEALPCLLERESQEGSERDEASIRIAALLSQSQSTTEDVFDQSEQNREVDLDTSNMLVGL
mmetsp:Transcript_33214/g.51686  ORF Transcript_33214/g.51686 Transcript_33214/m.51686 type:complete len:624 (-) Transcript_33214:212-2083(-)